MRVFAKKARDDTTLRIEFTPESEVEQNFLKVLAEMVVNGGRVRVDNADGERAIFRHDGILNARIRRGRVA